MEVRTISQGGQAALNYNNTTQVHIEDSGVSSGNQTNIHVSKENVQVGANEKRYEEKDVKKAVDKLNKLLEDSNTHVEYEVYDKFKDIIIKIVDDDTKKVIKEMPPRKILDMVAKLCEIAGVLVDQKA